jgi:hypothetical protein
LDPKQENDHQMESGSQNQLDELDRMRMTQVVYDKK